MKPKKLHTALIKAILAEYDGSNIAYLWKNNTGSTMIGNRFISFGHKGSADIIGIASNGLFVGIECKVGRDKLSKEQIAWRDVLVDFGGIYIEARSLEQVRTEMDKYRL